MKSMGLMLARQIKAARALLGWSQEDLAHAVGLSVATIGKLELGDSSRGATLNRLRDTFEENGIEFLGSEGVRFRRSDVAVYSGSDAEGSFLEDIQRSVKKKGEEISLISKTGTLFDFGPACAAESMEKLTALKNKMSVSIRCLLTEELASPLTTALCECRFLSKSYVDPAPLYVFADKFAFFEIGQTPKIIVIQSFPISQGLRKQFYSMWEKATPMHLADAADDLKKIMKRQDDYLTRQG
ncbi:MAG: helix-turn-helix domain-containing protein [Alphaproteobacteria bacterium]|nr:helix-turn-helix domain-containing protein [Alphaproteobacteria bacterium]